MSSQTLLFCFFLFSVSAWGGLKGEKKEEKNEKTEVKTEVKKEDPNRLTFTDKIKTLRSVGGEYDVFFISHYGPYSVPYSLPNSNEKDLSPEEKLRIAFKNGSEITVTVNPITETLLSIDSDISRSPSSSTTKSTEGESLSELQDFQELYQKHTNPKK